MRLWHYKLVKILPKNQLLGQHRECCALRGKGWGRKHSVVDYVFDQNYFLLFNFHYSVIQEMQNRGYKVEKSWTDPFYRGKRIGSVSLSSIPGRDIPLPFTMKYPDHNEEYLEECLENLRKKNITIGVE